MPYLAEPTSPGGAKLLNHYAPLDKSVIFWYAVLTMGAKWYPQGRTFHTVWEFATEIPQEG